jgi:hypothetical protein
VLLQKSCIAVTVLFLDSLHGSDPLPPTVSTVVRARTMIYAERFGTELVRAEPVLLDAGLTVSAMR